MANANIRADDLLLLQRPTGGTEQNFKITTGELLDFELDSFKDEIEFYIDGLEQEIIDRKDGDDALEIKLNTYRDYVRSGVDLLFPSVVEGDFIFKLSIQEQSTFINRYNQCLASYADPTDEETINCYYGAAAVAYNDLNADMTAKFEVLSSTDPNYKNTHTLIVNETTAGTTPNTIDWNLLAPNDYMSIGRHNSDGVSSDTDYGFYKVKKNLVADLSGTLIIAKPGLHMFELEYQSGNDLTYFFPTGVYSIRGMSDLKGDISGDFVSKTGDTMSGTLTIDDANIELVGSAKSGKAIHFKHDTDQTILKDTGKLKIQVGSESTTFLQDGTVEVTKTDKDVTESVVNVGHLDSKLSTFTIDIDQLEDDIKILEERIDAAIKVIDVFKFNTQDIDHQITSLDDWTTQTISSLVNGRLNFFDITLGRVQIVPNTQIHQRLIISLTDMDKLIGWGDNSIQEGDFLEFSCLDGNASDFIYKVVNYTNGGTYYQFDLENMFVFGFEELQDDKIYKMKQISSKQALTIDDANNRFVVKTGDTITGPLLINVTSTDSELFKISTTKNNNTFKVTDRGTFNISTEDVNDFCTFSSNDGSTQRTTKIRTDGVLVSANANVSYNIYLTNDSNPSLTLSTGTLDVKNKKITNVSLADISSPNDVVTVEYYNKHLKDRMIGGNGISITPSVDDELIISTTGTFSIGQASDVYTNDNWKTGDIIQYNESMNKFQKINIDQKLKGRNVAATNETDADVGGIWTDGSNYFIRTS